jgi:hypothetical protein
VPHPICLLWHGDRCICLLRRDKLSVCQVLRDNRCRLLEVYLLIFESPILVVVHDTRLLLGVTIEEDGLRFLIGVLRPAKEVNKVDEGDLSQETPGEDLIVLVSELLLNILLWVLIAQEGVQKVREGWDLSRFEVS